MKKCQRLLKSMIHISQTYTAFIITVTLTIKKKKTYRSQPLVYLFEMVFDLISVSSSHLNVTFLLFKVSDDEDDTHPNIDTPSLFRWRHQARVERMEEAKKERDAVETKISE